MMEVVVTTGAIRRANSSQTVITNKPTPNFFTGWMPLLSPNQQCQSTEVQVNWNLCSRRIYQLSWAQMNTRQMTYKCPQQQLGVNVISSAGWLAVDHIDVLGVNEYSCCHLQYILSHMTNVITDREYLTITNHSDNVSSAALATDWNKTKFLRPRPK